MKTNSFFNFNRFVQLAKQDVMLNRNKYLLIFLLFALGLYTLIVFQMDENPYGYVYHHQVHVNASKDGWAYLNLFIMVLIGYAVFVGTSFSGLGDKVKRANYLIVPASTFEKYLFPYLFRMVFGLILFTLIFWIDARLARLTLMHAPTFVQEQYDIVPFQLSMFYDSFLDLFVNFERMLIILSVGLYLFVVPLFFKKQAFIKAVVSLFVVIFLFYVVLVGFSHLFDPNLHGFNVNIENFKISKRESILDCFSLFVTSVGSVFLLLLGYFKLKEKQL
jgi:hypothetical protein